MGGLETNMGTSTVGNTTNDKMPPSHAEIQRLKWKAGMSGIWTTAFLAFAAVGSLVHVALALCLMFVAGMAFTWALVRMDQWLDADTRAMHGQSGLR